LLFRQKAISAHRKKLYGEILISSPKYCNALILFLVSIILFIIYLVYGVAYSESISVRVVIHYDNETQIRAPRSGTFTMLDFTEYEIVEEGQILGFIVPSADEISPTRTTINQYSHLRIYLDDSKERYLEFQPQDITSNISYNVETSDFAPSTEGARFFLEQHSLAILRRYINIAPGMNLNAEIQINYPNIISLLTEKKTNSNNQLQ